jgi:predicted adenine nucleotide alpha hydrolase (AANH) superfamily ATPase
VVLFWYNPNITDADEYERRLAEVRRYADLAGVELVEGPRDTEAWEAATAGLEEEPEGGRRCDICFGLRLEAAAAEARRQGLGHLTTTLTVSPHKSFAKVVEAAQVAGCGGAFLAIDFKKQGGTERSLQLSREYGLYRQDYCGCEPSRRAREHRRRR